MLFPCVFGGSFILFDMIICHPPIMLLLHVYLLFPTLRSFQKPCLILGGKQQWKRKWVPYGRNDTWELVSLPSGISIVGCRWVFAVKVHPDGIVDKLKARVVAKGYTPNLWSGLF